METNREKKVRELLYEICTIPGICFVQVGESSFFVMEEEEFKEIGEDAARERAMSMMNTVLCSMPDFRTMTVSDGLEGGIVIMQNHMWEIVLPEEFEWDSNGNMDFSCALSARSRLLESCEKGEIWDIFVI